jgi:hypothetical protein
VKAINRGWLLRCKRKLQGFAAQYLVLGVDWMRAKVKAMVKLVKCKTSAKNFTQYRMGNASTWH